MKLRDESGQAMAMTAFGFGILLAFMALAVDTGILFHAKGKLQTAADAAAIAGALDYLYNGSTSSAQTAARSASGDNGYTDGAGGVTVTVNSPAASGPNAGTGGTVEAIVSKSVPLTFMSIFGFSNMTVQARAVAGAPTAGSTCLWLMDPNGTGLYLQGGYDIEAPGCGIYINSASPNAVSITGGGGTLNALFAAAVGSTVGHQTSPTPVGTYTAPRRSPWGNLTGPDPTTGSGCTTWDTATTTLSGALTGPGAGNTACYSMAVTLNNATFGAGTLGTSTATNSVTSSAGTLAFGNGVTVSGTVTVFGGTIDIYSGTFNQPGNALVNIIAPTSGSYNGIALMQPASNTSQLQVQLGRNNQVLDGYIYAPGAQVYLQDNGGGVLATGIVADSLYDNSSTIRLPSYDKAHPTTTTNRVLALLE